MALKLLCEGSAPISADIVFIHGLRGDSMQTWSKGDICWPRDLLPKEMPNLRVLTWGYDSSIANLTSGSSQASIFGHADGLLSDLARMRRDPHIALIRSSELYQNQENLRLGAIYTSTRGVLFLGTPHRGSKYTDYLGIVKLVAKVTWHNPNEQLLQTLAQHSQVLERQRRSFATISGRDKLQIACFYEEVPWKNLGLIVPEDSAVIDGYGIKRGSVPANHSDMCKFASVDDVGFKRVADCIFDFVEDAEKSSLRLDVNINKIVLDMLNFQRINSRHEEVSENYRESFTWILDKDYIYPFETPELSTSHGQVRAEFRSWLREGENTFWISGKAGSGKSTLMKLVREASQTRQHLEYWAGDLALIIGHFYFFDRGSALEKSQIGLFRTILYQILLSRPSLIRPTFEHVWDRLQMMPVYTTQQHQYQTSEKEGFSKNEVLVALRNLLTKATSTMRICLFIDGLDEYEGPDREIATLIQELVKHHGGKTNRLKVCLSSRPHAAFENTFSECPRLRLQDLTRADIHRYVYGQLSGHSRYKPNLDQDYTVRFDKIVESVVKQAYGVFVWVRLAVMSLLDGLDQYDWISELEERVMDLPPELETFYHRMVHLIDRRYLAQAVRIFRLMLDSNQPPICAVLSFVEKGENQIASLTIEDSFPERLNARGTQMALRLKSKCGGLVEVFENPAHWNILTVTFFHQTVREYFLQDKNWQILLQGNLISLCDSKLYVLIERFFLQSALYFSAPGRNQSNLTNKDVDSFEKSKQALELVIQEKSLTGNIGSNSFHNALRLLGDEDFAIGNLTKSRRVS